MKKQLIILAATSLLSISFPTFSASASEMSEKKFDLSISTHAWGALGISQFASAAAMTYFPNITAGLGFYVTPSFRLGLDIEYFKQPDHVAVGSFSPTYELIQVSETMVPYIGMRVGGVAMFSSEKTEEESAEKKKATLMTVAGVLGLGFKVSENVKIAINYEPTKFVNISEGSDSASSSPIIHKIGASFKYAF